MKNCGTCEYARMLPNLSQRICRGAPPQIVAVPLPNGVQLKHMWPTVEAADEGCGAYRAKIVIDHVNNEVVQ